MGKNSDRSIDEVEREIMMTTQSNLGSKDATREKDAVKNDGADTYRHQGRKY